MNQEMIERFALAQAMYSQLASIVNTKDSDNLRAEIDGDIYQTWATTGAEQYPITLGGEKVGNISVKTSTGYNIVNHEQFNEWAKEAGYIDEVEYPNPDFNWQQWSIDEPEQYYRIREILRSVPGFFATDNIIINDWTDGVTHEGDAVFDVETGEQLPFIKWQTKFTGTTVSGCKWQGGPKKYIEVRDTAFVRNRLRSSPIAALLEGGTDGDK